MLKSFILSMLFLITTLAIAEHRPVEEAKREAEIQALFQEIKGLRMEFPEVKEARNDGVRKEMRRLLILLGKRSDDVSMDEHNNLLLNYLGEMIKCLESDKKNQKAFYSKNRPATAKEIRTLISQLGDASYTKRRVAQLALRDVGSKAIPHLKAVIKSGDLELKHRAQAALEYVDGTFTFSAFQKCLNSAVGNFYPEYVHKSTKAAGCKPN